MGQELSIDLTLLVDHRGEFIKILSAEYPLPKRLLEKYIHVWDWYLLSRNTATEWNVGLIDQFKDKWQWHTLSRNQSIPWNEDLLEQFKNQWDWHVISSFNPAVPWSVSLLNKFKKKLWWGLLGREPDLINNRNILNVFFDHWTTDNQKDLFRVNMPDIKEENYPWVTPFFEQNSHLDWKWFSAYKGFPWTKEFILKHKGKLDWELLSRNEGLPWDMEFIEQYAHKWDWVELSQNRKLPWTKELLDKYVEKWDWVYLSGSMHYTNDGIVWNTELVAHFADKLYWAYPIFMFQDFEYMEGLFNYSSIVWTPELYKKCDLHISNHFKKLEIEFEQDFKDAEFYLTYDGDFHWTYYQNGENWSISYLKMLIELALERPAIEFINWDRLHIMPEIVNNKELIEFMDTSSNEEAIEYCFRSGNAYFFKKYADRISNDYIWGILSHSKNLKLDELMLKKYEDKWNWGYLASNPSLTPILIEQFKDKWNDPYNWRELSLNPNLTIDTIEKFKDKWNWKELSTNPDLTQDIIYKYADKWDWEMIFKNQKLTIETIKKIKNHIDWWWAVYFRQLDSNKLFSQALLEEFLNKIEPST